MKVEYTVLLACAVLGVGAFASLGQGMARSVASEGPGGRAPTMALSQQAGVSDAFMDASRAATELTERVRAEGMALAGTEPRLAAIRGRRVEDSLMAIADGNFLKFHGNRLPVSMALDGGFGVDLDRMPAALAAWKAAPAATPSTTVRRWMDGNLRLLETALVDRQGRFDADRALWGALPHDDAELDRVRMAVVETLGKVRSALLREALSKQEVHGILRDFVRTDSIARGDFESSGAFAEAPTGNEAFMPLVSSTGAYWSYDRVMDWHDVGMYPAEVPTGDKQYDGFWGAAAAYSKHDLNHIATTLTHNYRYGVGMDLDAFQQLKPAIARLATSSVAAERGLGARLRQVLGHTFWEKKSLQESVERLPRTVETGERQGLLAWLEAFEQGHVTAAAAR